MFKDTLKFMVHRRLPVLFESLSERGQVMPKYYRGLLDTKYILHTRIYLDSKVYWLEDEFNKLSQEMIRRYERNDVFLWKIARLCYQQGDNLVDYSKKINQQDIKYASNRELIKWFNGFVERSLMVMKYLNLPLAMEDYFTSNLQRIISNHFSGSQVDKYFKQLTSPIKQNDVVLERRNLLLLVKYIKTNIKLVKLFHLSWSRFKSSLTNHPTLQQKLNQHLLNYAWLPCPYYVGVPTSLKNLFDSIRKLLKSNISKELAVLVNEPRIIHKQTDKIMLAGKFSIKEKNFVRIVQEYVYLRTYRTDIIHKSGLYMRPVFKEIGRRAGLTYDEVMSLNFKEIINIFKRLPQRAVIKKRRAGYISYCHGQKFVFVTGREMGPVRKRLLKMLPKVRLDVTGLSGQSAYDGKIRGMARVVLKTTELGKVLKGDILITSMTTPQFMPAMKKAAAFVTDEGGILCHAAIVSREMKKPCIIGTKIATKVLKDGDLVEVDANKGIVRKLK